MKRISPRTQELYQKALRSFREWYWQRYESPPDYDLLTEEEVREYLTTLREEGLSASSRNLALAALKWAARQAGNRLEVPMEKAVPPPIETLTPRELGRLVRAARQAQPEWVGLRNEALIALLARAGLRLGEALALKVDDITLRPRSGFVLVRYGKGGKQRQVPLSAEARRALHRYLTHRHDVETDALFVSNWGRPLSRRTVQATISEAAKKAGIERRVTPHVLRHTFATRLIENGADLASVQALLGHSSLATTQRYLHPDQRRMQEMVEGM